MAAAGDAPRPPLRVVRRFDGGHTERAAMRLELAPIGGGHPPAVFEWVEGSPVLGSGDPFEVLAEVRGQAHEARFPVFADWVIGDRGDPAGFEGSRRELFALRAREIPVFYTDWLLRRLDDPSRYTVLGLYATEEGLSLSRGHPAIAAWAGGLPGDLFGAKDESGPRMFHVERFDGPDGPLRTAT